MPAPLLVPELDAPAEPGALRSLELDPELLTVESLPTPVVPAAPDELELELVTDPRVRELVPKALPEPSVPESFVLVDAVPYEPDEP